MVASPLAPVSLAAPQVLERCPTLDSRLTWYGDNLHRLQEFVDAFGSCARPGRHPLAVFDWDNTMVKNDVGDATTAWLLRNGKVRQPERKDWSTTSRYLTPAATAALSAACGDAADPGEALPTGTDTRCADEILSVYSEGTTTGRQAAFAGFDHRRIEPSLAWAAQLLAGCTPGEVTAFAEEARRESLAAPVGSTETVGSRRVTAWVRYYDRMRDLTGALRRAGFDVRIVSASAEPVVRVWAAGLGIAAEKVIGIRNQTYAGRLTSHLASCGDAEPDSVIPYIDGKRCFINQEILKITGGGAFDRAPDGERQVFAAGDSDTDVTFVGDATGLRLVINRNYAELMCHAYADSDRTWLVNPMFIEPLPARTSLYPCSTTAYTRPDGTKGPVLDDHGAVIPDQADTVY
ncbi:haloacid dehalogenase-like hydrolase [Kitasatospora sp. HPMI-4]|uniref:haloacid dehalogenase-like hydrolase n=1 Tax=Kitasatospora sp. HPMI-4 TaxID=3448443 RepID=UPI003F1AB91B